MFAAYKSNLHGGRRRRTHRNRAHKMRGGAVAYPDAFSQELPTDMREAANVAVLDSAFGALPSFAGKYGGMAGGARRVQFGGVAPVEMPGMLLSPQEEAAAMLNKNWYDENLVNPAFKAPEAHIGGRRRRASRKASRKANRKSRKANRKANRKSRKANRKANSRNGRK